MFQFQMLLLLNTLIGYRKPVVKLCLRTIDKRTRGYVCEYTIKKDKW